MNIIEGINCSLKSLLIVSITPYFLEKPNIWFTKNLEKILLARQLNSFFQDNILYLEENSCYSFSEILRKLDEMGYERVFRVSEPGELSQRGGVIDIFPVNSSFAVRLDFIGNKLQSIQKLDIEIQNEQKAKEILKKKLKSQKVFSDLKGIKPGDYLVHLDHGIGKFIKKTTLAIKGSAPQEYYVLEYAKNDKLYVPINLERKLSRYIGFHEPQLTRLGSSLWQKTKKKIKEEAEKFAKELLQLYAQKEITSRTPYIEDKELELCIKSSFPFEETPDQLQAIEDIKRDFSQSKPIDRLICGDVGFGKTEIAIRASFLAAINNRQTAFICPTTLLAHQHFFSFKKRFEKLPINVSLLTRLQTPSQQREILKNLNEGKIDIIIGTHRLLAKDVKFKNLQLLIIDDEHKFGVKQKEKLRKLQPSLDVLSLSATPIPRTLYLALSSFKKISQIQTPPLGKQSIKTHILPYHPKIIEKIIKKELKKGGQVYFLHNRIQTIKKTACFIKKICPHARIGIVHGKMSEKELIKTMEKFQNEKINILIATTIIESGLDLPKVNTIIVEDANRLGLAQAHQIRGRVGRAGQEGFAYFFYHPSSLTSKGKERLKILKESQELGMGFQIALKDLELRGAGNILGKEQWGAINKVGLNLYAQILSETLEKLKDKK